MTKVKICGIKSPAMAEVCAQAGADYIGLVFAETSLRYITVSQAKGIVQAAKNLGVEPVAVFNQASEEQILNIVYHTGISTIQVHGEVPEFPQHLSCIYAAVYPFKMPTSVRPHKDFILFDNENPGSGCCVLKEQLPSFPNHTVFLAGGLNAGNVIEAIDSVRPYGVDCSTGVESSPGVKSKTMIQAFISIVKEHQHG